MIELKNVRYRYSKSNIWVVDDFSCQFQKGMVTALTGKNGCGKTTITKLIVGILHQNSGEIIIDGESTEKMDLFSIGKQVGYVFQEPSRQLFCDSVLNEVKYGLLNMGLSDADSEQRATDYLDRFYIAHLAGSYPGKLSRGEKQRTALAAVLAMGTKYVILDEPTTGLDLRSRRQLGELLTEIKELGTGVIVVSHEREFIKKYTDVEIVVP